MDFSVLNFDHLSAPFVFQKVLERSIRREREVHPPKVRYCAEECQTEPSAAKCMAARGAASEPPRAALLPPAAPATPRPSLSPSANLDPYAGHFSITR
ncbi:hypothetical protein TNCV_3631651 [Trichonephila clavipes]|nr:hypothetical protein TNCV_3631651 [Trichonephila clavipes]